VQEANVSEIEYHPDIQSDVQETNKFVTELADKAIQALPLTTSIGIQVSHSFFNYIKSNDNLYTMTGIPNFKILKMLENLIRLTVPEKIIQSFKKLSLQERIIMTFIKLKCNLKYRVLCVMFQVFTEENCRKIVLSVIDILCKSLKYAIHWPSREEIRKNIPLCFNEFTDVRAVIDVIELSIQKPKKLCCQIASYSSYKGTYTVRFMTAVSPGGLITFISKPFMGRTSDKAIFTMSDFIKLFEIGDAVMTDKGFLIDDVCFKHNVKLIRPPFLSKKVQFSKEEAILNAKIARARVHIERSNQRLKEFSILSTKVPSYLVPRIEQIFTIICAVVNLSSPILKDDKFNK